MKHFIPDTIPEFAGLTAPSKAVKKSASRPKAYSTLLQAATSFLMPLREQAAGFVAAHEDFDY